MVDSSKATLPTGLEGAHCVISGGAGSIGQATARTFLDAGANVMIGDLTQPTVDGPLTGADAARWMTKKVDVTQADQVQGLVDASYEKWGEIDVLFCNAGNFGTVAPIADYPEDVFMSVLQVHVLGVFLLCKYAAPKMRKGGRIIITSSVAGTRGDPGVYGYITAKHAQVGLMRCLAKELAPRNIRVNTVHPGPIDNGFQHHVEEGLGAEIGRDGAEFFNEQIPLGRHGDPEEIAQAVLFLASNASSYITGSTLMVDGGMSA